MFKLHAVERIAHEEAAQCRERTHPKAESTLYLSPAADEASDEEDGHCRQDRNEQNAQIYTSGRALSGTRCTSWTESSVEQILTVGNASAEDRPGRSE